MRHTKLLLLTIVIALISAFFYLDGQQYITISTFREWVNENVLTASLAYLGLYILVAALSLPGAAAFTLLGGAVFGLWLGVLLVSFASSVGATLAFLLSRTLFANIVNVKFGKYLNKINAGVDREGAFYLFTLRLIPAVPFFVVNLVFGLTKIKVWTFYWVSQIGMFAGTIVFVNAGAQLGAVEELSVAGVLTPSILGAFVLLAIFPYVVRIGVRAWKAYSKT
jgi:uncharacterized membrane protein YdjX (TVP38/TMEM64 family)